MPDQLQSVFAPALARRGASYGAHPPLVRHNLGLYQPGLGDPDPDSLGALFPLPAFLSTIPPTIRLALIAGGSWLIGRRTRSYVPWLVGAAVAYATDSLPGGLTFSTAGATPAPVAPASIVIGRGPPLGPLTQ